MMYQSRPGPPGYLNVLSFRSGPEEIIEKLRECGYEAFSGYIDKMEEERKKLEGKLCGRRSLEQKMFQKILKGQQAEQEKKQDFEVLSFADLRNAAGKRILMDLKDFPGTENPDGAEDPKRRNKLSAGDDRADDRSSGLVGDHDTFDGTWVCAATLSCLPQRPDGGKRGRREFSVPEDQKGIGKCRLPGEESPLFYGNFRSELLWCLRGNGFFRLCVGDSTVGRRLPGRFQGDREVEYPGGPPWPMGKGHPQTDRAREPKESSCGAAGDFAGAY